MTIQEIKELVSKKIAGQGSQVDIGGALAEILNGIVDNIPQPKSFTFSSFVSFEGKTAAEVVALNIGFASEAEVVDFYEKALNGEYDFIKVMFEGRYHYELFYGGKYADSQEGFKKCGYISSTNMNDGVNCGMYLERYGSLFSAQWFEV